MASKDELLALVNYRALNSRFHIHSLKYVELRNLLVISLVAFSLGLAYVLAVVAWFHNDVTLEPEHESKRELEGYSIEAATSLPVLIESVRSLLFQNLSNETNVTLAPTVENSSVVTDAPTFAPTFSPEPDITARPSIDTEVPVTPSLPSASTFPTVFPTSSPTIDFNETIRQILNYQEGELVLRSIFSGVMTFLLILFPLVTYKVISRNAEGEGSRSIPYVRESNCSWKICRSLRECFSVISKFEESTVISSLLLTAWLLPELNPIVTTADFVLFARRNPLSDISKNSMRLLMSEETYNFDYDEPCIYPYLWPRFRYNAIASSAFVGGLFYTSMYWFKWIRLNMHANRIRNAFTPSYEKSFSQNQPAYTPVNNLADILMDSTLGGSGSAVMGYTQTADVRSLTGQIPRVVAFYVLSRILFQELFEFDMGFIPGISFITVARMCREGGRQGGSENPYWDSCEEPFSCSEDTIQVKIGFIVAFSLWEWGMIVWVGFQAYRTWIELSATMFLFARQQFVSYCGILSIYLLHWVALFVCGTLLISTMPQEFLFTDRLTYVGVQTGGSGLMIVVLSWLLSLSWSFTPSSTLSWKSLQILRREDGRQFAIPRAKAMYFPNESQAIMFAVAQELIDLRLLKRFRENYREGDLSLSPSLISPTSPLSVSAPEMRPKGLSPVGRVSSTGSVLTEYSKRVAQSMQNIPMLKSLIDPLPANNADGIRNERAKKILSGLELSGIRGNPSPIVNVTNGEDVKSREDQPYMSRENLVDREILVKLWSTSFPKFFIFDIAVLLWNISFITYLTGSSTYPQPDDEVQLLVEDSSFTVCEQISDDLTESHCLVLESENYIIVAFRGNGNVIPPSSQQLPRMAPHRVLSYRQQKAMASASSVTSAVGAFHSTSGERKKNENGKYMDQLELGMENNRKSEVDNLKTEVYGPMGDGYLSKCLHYTFAFGKQIDLVPRVREDLWTPYERISEKVIAVVKQLLRGVVNSEESAQSEPRTVLLTGHGSGGAMAAFCAYDLKTLKDFPVEAAVYTFGMPRLCNTTFRRYYSSRVTQHFDICNTSDKLHGVAGSSLYGCMHVGTTVVLDKVGNIVLRPDKLETQIMQMGINHKYNAHQTIAYTLALMQWAYRTQHIILDESDQQVGIREMLWSSCLHEVKMHCDSNTLRYPDVKGYLNISS